MLDPAGLVERFACLVEPAVLQLAQRDVHEHVGEAVGIRAGPLEQSSRAPQRLARVHAQIRIGACLEREQRRPPQVVEQIAALAGPRIAGLEQGAEDGDGLRIPPELDEAQADGQRRDSSPPLRAQTREARLRLSCAPQGRAQVACIPGDQAAVVDDPGQPIGVVACELLFVREGLAGFGNAVALEEEVGERGSVVGGLRGVRFGLVERDGFAEVGRGGVELPSLVLEARPVREQRGAPSRLRIRDRGQGRSGLLEVPRLAKRASMLERRWDRGPGREPHDRGCVSRAAVDVDVEVGSFRGDDDLRRLPIGPPRHLRRKLCIPRRDPDGAFLHARQPEPHLGARGDLAHGAAQHRGAPGDLDLERICHERLHGRRRAVPSHDEDGARGAREDAGRGEERSSRAREDGAHATNLSFRPRRGAGPLRRGRALSSSSDATRASHRRSIVTWTGRAVTPSRSAPPSRSRRTLPSCRRRARA